MSIEVLLADDHAIVRQGIRALLAGAVGIEVIGEAADGHEAVAMAMAKQPDVLIMDINMPHMDGLAALSQIQQEVPQTRVLILSMHERIEMVHQAVQNGALGYVLKASLYDELEAAVRTVAAGQLYRSDVMARYLDQYLVTNEEIPLNPLDQLTAREQEVLQLLVHGYRSQDIAEQLYLSKKTVDKHRANIMKKLNARTPIELGHIYARYSRTSTTTDLPKPISDPHDLSHGA